MPLATKNNAIIVKDGNVAENCNCCASGWWCYGESCASAVSLVRMRITSSIAAQNDEIATRQISGAFSSATTESEARLRVSRYLNTLNSSSTLPYPSGRQSRYSTRTPFSANQWKTLSLSSSPSCSACDYRLIETVGVASVTWRVIVSACHASCQVTVTAFQVPALVQRIFAAPDIGPDDARITAEFSAQFQSWSAGFTPSNGSCFTPPTSQVMVESASGGTLTDTQVRYALRGSGIGSSSFSSTQPYTPGVPVYFSLPCVVNSSPLGESNTYNKSAPLAETTYSPFSTASQCPLSVSLSTAFAAEVEVTVI